MMQDVKIWCVDLIDWECYLLIYIFCFFIQVDVDVVFGYIDWYLLMFKFIEICMVMVLIVVCEGVYIQVYFILIDELGILEVEYFVFMGYKEMLDKYEYLFQWCDGLEGLVLDIVVFLVFGEGLQFFFSFIMLFNFIRFGKMMGMGQVVSWFIWDEILYVEFMMKVYYQLLVEYFYFCMVEYFECIREIVQKMVELEFVFIDLVYEFGENQGFFVEDVKQYICYIVDQCFVQFGECVLFGVSKNFLGWVDVIVFGKEYINFFENWVMDYFKGVVMGSWDDVFG